MEPIGARCVRAADFIGKMKKITSKNGRGSQNFHSGSPEYISKFILSYHVCITRRKAAIPVAKQGHAHIMNKGEDVWLKKRCDGTESDDKKQDVNPAAVSR
jgi:hypothetical protein